MARFISGAANSAPRAHQAGASCAGSLATQAPATCTGLTGRCRGRLHQWALRPRQAGAPELGR